MVMYGLLIILAARNIWVILVKQSEYRNLPLLAFYAFGMVAITFREITIVGYWTKPPVIANADFVQQAAKLCVGVVQDWITLELAIRIHNAKGYSDISAESKKKLRFASGVLFAAITVTFFAFSFTVIASARKEGSDGFAFDDIGCLVVDIIAWCFLCQVIVMVLLVVWLFVETQRAVNREMQLNGRVMHTLRRERCTYALISTFFGLSYVGRFALNEYNTYTCGGYSWIYYSVFMAEILVWFFEAASMGLLMMFHSINFNQGNPILSD